MDSKYRLLDKNFSQNQNIFQVKRKLASHFSPFHNNKKSKQTALSDSSFNNVSNVKIYNNGEVMENKCILEQRKQLPLYLVRNRFLQEIRRLNTVIVISETGSGKTTQIPQFLYESGLSERGIIGVTQPRRVAAITIARRVAQEKQSALGELVGYTVRFEDATSENTRIKYMTDGSLLREALNDKYLKAYSVIILDEAHERTVNTDLLFGIVKDAQKIRAENNMLPLKIVIMSATMDVDHFSNYFNNCPTIYLEGRMYPVKIFHVKTQQNDYLQTCLVTLFDIHQNAPINHDVLIFLTGQEEIEAMSQQIKIIAKGNDLNSQTLRVFPLYSQLPQHKQLEVFKRTTLAIRRVILATNIAETSLTIAGIKYVIDSGVVKRRVYNSSTGLDTLKIVKISQAQAWQRTGRAGRESEGLCYRAYTASEYNVMPLVTVPEILRSNLATVVLQLLALGINCNEFDFMDMPPKPSIDFAYKLLYDLNAITTINKPMLTSVGCKMSRFPLDPRFSKIILSAPEYGCLEEILSLIAILSGENIFIKNNDKRDQILLLHKKFESKYGDHLTLLNVFNSFQNMEKPKVWCHENFLNFRNLSYAKDVREQLKEICNICGFSNSSCGSNFDQVRKCLLSGLFNNIAELQRDNFYLSLTSRQKARIHPSSVMHGKSHVEFIIFTEMVATAQNFMRLVTPIEFDWLKDLPTNVINRSGLDC